MLNLAEHEKRVITSRSGPKVIKRFPFSTQLSTKFILLINVEMPTIVGILTFISMINTTSERLQARKVFICPYFSFYQQLKFHAQLSCAPNKLYVLRAWSTLYRIALQVLFYQANHVN